MNDLGEQRFGVVPEVEDLLALEVEASALAGDAREMLRPLLGEVARTTVFREPRVLDGVAAGDDLHAVFVEVKRRREADRTRRHGVPDARVFDDSCRTDGHRELERVVLGRDRERAESQALLLDPLGRHDAGRARWPLGVGFVEPLLS